MAVASGAATRTLSDLGRFGRFYLPHTDHAFDLIGTVVTRGRAAIHFLERFLAVIGSRDRGSHGRVDVRSGHAPAHTYRDTSMLEFDGVNKRFGELAALDDCAFAARPGRLTGFLGPDGAGSKEAIDRWTSAVLIGIGAALGVAVVTLAHDVVMGLAVDAGVYAVSSRIMDARRHAAPRRAPWRRR